MALTVETIDDVARFEALKPEWEELLANSAADCVFLSWEWLYTWWRRLSGKRRLHLILVRDRGRLIALAPLALRPRQWRRLLPFPALEFLGVGSVGSDYLDIIIRRGEERRALAALAGALKESGRMVDLSQVAATGSYAVELARELGGQGWRTQRTMTDRCPYIDFAGDLPEQAWESYLSILGASHRYNLRRRTKNLERRWRVGCERAATEEQRAEGIRNVVLLHGLRWRNRGEAGVFHDPAVIAFHHELSRLALARGWLRLYLLRLDDRIAVAWYGFHYHGVTYFYQTGFDPAFYKHSVGLVMMSHAIRAALEEGARVYDFLRGDETYKSLWACRERELVRLELFPPSRHGAFCRHAMAVRLSIKKVISRSGIRNAPLPVAAPGHEH